MNKKVVSAIKYIIFAVFLLILPRVLPNQYIVQIVNMILIYVILATGVNILTGYTGQLSLGQAAFFGIGAYTAAILNKNFGLQFISLILISAFVTAIFGVILSVPALKVKGSYLALITIGFGEIVRILMVNWVQLTRGPAGIVGIEAPRIFGITFDDLNKYYYLILFFVIIGLLYQKILIESRIGRAFIAIREDDTVAELTGINITEFKVKAFVIGAVYSSVAGVLYAMMIRYVSPDSFTGNDSSIILWTVIIGGIGTLAGPVVGAIVMTILPEALRGIGNMRMVIFGIVLLIVIIKYPSGLTPYFIKFKDYIWSTITNKKTLPARK